MTRNTVRFALLSAGGLGALLIPSAGWAQAEGRYEVGIYKGDPPAQAGIELKSWGSGEAKESEEFIYTGSKSIRVSTQGRYQGGRLVLQKPLDLSTSANDKSAYLEFVVHPGDKDATGGGGRTGFPGFGGAPAGMMQGMGRMMGAGGGGKLGGPGGAGGGGDVAKMVKARPFANLRAVLVTTNNRRYEMDMPLDGAPRTRQEDWRRFAIPIAAIGGGKGIDGPVKEIQIFGDSPTYLYVGEIRVTHDDTPIRVGDLPERIVPVNEELTFTASADAGSSPLKYEWTFYTNVGDEQSRNVDAEGRTAKHRFRKSGDYTVTLTVSDPYGIKKPVTTKTKVTVTL